MARIESVAKAGYYPTPERITTLLANTFHRIQGRRTRQNGFRILDPCCGAGEAPAEIATKIASLGYATTTYGIELNKERATAARRNLNEVLHCDFFHTTIAHDSMDMLWLNPPYDIQSPDQAYKRAEGAYLKRAIPYLKKATGLLVFIVPRKSLLDTASTISREFRNVRCVEFPHPEVDNFDQIILTAQRKERPDPSQTQTQTLRSIATGRTELNPLNRPPDHYSHYLPKQTHEPADILFNSMSIDVAEALSEAARKGILSSPTIRERFWPSKHLTALPVLPLRQGHIALMTAAGFLDNQILPGQDGTDPLIIKGRTYKETLTTASAKTSRTESEVMRTTIRSLNLRTGERQDIKP